MKAYKATYNFKCRDQLYRVGKLYTSDKLQICKHGFHYCPDMQDTLNYYMPQDDFVLLEIEVLGKHETQQDKGATDKMRVLRVVPPEEYPEEMRKRFDVIKRDQNNRIVSRIDGFGHKMVYQYDDRGNMIVENDTKMDYDDNNRLVRKTFPSGNFIIHTYDERGNKIATKDNRGYHETFEYDELNRLTKQTYATDSWYEYAYDERGNMISNTDERGFKYTYQYDELNRQINYTTPSGRVYTFEYANVTEED
jgi:YD repeat-containing protein